MKYALSLYFLIAIPVFLNATLKINEIKVNPNPGTADPEVQALSDCNNPSFGAAWIELYNNSKCDTIFLECFVLSVQTSSDNGGSFAFPQGAFIEPLGFLVIGGGNVPDADFVIADFCNSGSICGADLWELENNFGWAGIFDNTGAVLDAIFYTETTGQATSINNHPNFDHPTCVPAICGDIPALAQPNELTPGTEIIYAGRAPDTGTTIKRETDGQPGWQTNATPTQGTCNGVCAEPDKLEVLINVILQESCFQSDGIATVEITGGNAPYEILWGDGQSTDTVTNLSDGLIEVLVTDDKGCTDEDFSLIINEGGEIDLSIEPENPAVFLGEFTELELISTNPIAVATWSPGTGLSCQSCLNPLAGPSFTTTYSVEAEDVFGCLQSATVTVQVVDDAASVFVPNAFTPDQEVNHTLFVRSPRIETMDFSIYDRWGNRVFFTTDQNEGWDGRSPAGEALPSGVFVYQLDVILENGRRKTLTGNIHLIR